MRAYLVFFFILIPILAISQSRNGSFNGTNHVHYQVPSVNDLSFLKNDDQSVEVFVFPMGGDRNTNISEQLKNIKLIVMNRLMENGIKLESGDIYSGKPVRNEIHIGLNALQAGNNDSYLIRMLVKSGAYTDYKEKYSYKSGVILWEEIHFGVVKNGNYSKIKEHILSSVESLIKAIGD